MGCARGLCVPEKMFIFVNITLAMYSGALLATAARLMWDPSTYTWFRFLCATQYRACTAYVFAAGAALAALVYLAAAAALRRHLSSLHVYCAGVACLAGSEVAFGAWLCASLAAWWRAAPQAELARRGLDLVHDLKPALLAVDRYRDVARPIYEMIEEVEREAPNNAYVIIAVGVLGAALQVAAFVLARRLLRRETRDSEVSEKAAACGGADVCEEDSDEGGCSREPLPGARKKANLRMYTILDKIF